MDGVPFYNTHTHTHTHTRTHSLSLSLYIYIYIYKWIGTMCSGGPDILPLDGGVFDLCVHDILVRYPLFRCVPRKTREEDERRSPNICHATFTQRMLISQLDRIRWNSLLLAQLVETVYSELKPATPLSLSLVLTHSLCLSLSLKPTVRVWASLYCD